ncbi:hypothetical protein ANTQUA_LOCUS1638 [Anthophora quadrimaculata]
MKDNGRVSTVSIASYITRGTIENIYSCYIYHYRNKSIKASSHVIFTFGIIVIDKSEEFVTIHWKDWSFVCGSIIICFIFVIIWCVLEIIQDVRNGHGFYRLPQMFNNDRVSTINFILSKSGVTLLGSQQAANEIVSGIVDNN